MEIIYPSSDTIQMLYTQWQNFQWWYSALAWTTIIEAVVITALIIYLGRNHWKPLGQSILHELKTYSETVCRAQRELGTRKEISPFSIGKFWAFVFSGLFTLITLSCLLIVGYFAAVGEGIATNNSTEKIQIITSNNLLYQLKFVQAILWLIFIVSMLVIFRDYIELLWKRLQEKRWIGKPEKPLPVWIYRGERYSILILFTTFCFLALVELCMFIPFSNQGSDALTFNIIVPGMSYLAQSWCNLVGAINPISVILIVYWICSVWLMAFGYLLRDELNWLWEKFKQLLKYLYHGLFPVVL